MPRSDSFIDSILTPKDGEIVVETYGACVFRYKGCRNIGILGEEKGYLRAASEHYGTDEPYGLCVECWDKNRGRCPGPNMDIVELREKAFKTLGITIDNWKEEAETRNLGHLSEKAFLKKVLKTRADSTLRPRHIYPGTCSICKKSEDEIDEDYE